MIALVCVRRSVSGCGLHSPGLPAVTLAIFFGDKSPKKQKINSHFESLASSLQVGIKAEMNNNWRRTLKGTQSIADRVGPSRSGGCEAERMWFARLTGLSIRKPPFCIHV